MNVAEAQRTAEQVGGIIHVLREERAWSLRELSRRTATEGPTIAASRLCMLEQGRGQLTAAQLAQLARVFGVTVGSLFGESHCRRSEAA